MWFSLIFDNSSLVIVASSTLVFEGLQASPIPLDYVFPWPGTFHKMALKLAPWTISEPLGPPIVSFIFPSLAIQRTLERKYRERKVVQTKIAQTK